MRKKSKWIGFFASLVLFVVCVIGGGCNEGTKKGKSAAYFGGSVDGVEMSRDWSFADDSFSTKGNDAESLAFSKQMLNDYAFSYSVKVTSESQGEEPLLGGYAYYADMDNYVKYSIQPDDHTISIKWAHGFDSEERTNQFDASLDFSNYVSVGVEKIGTQFKFLINREIVQSRIYDLEDSAQVGIVNQYISASYKDYRFEEINEFSSAPISRKAFRQLNRDSATFGVWDIDGNHIENDCSGRWESLLLQGQASNMALELDITRIAVDGNEPLAGISVYENASNWVSLFFNPTHAEVYLCEKTYQGWTGGGSYQYDASKPVNVRIEKLGSRIQFMMNGEIFKTIDSNTFISAMFAIETKHSKQEIEIKAFEEIDAFTENYDFAPMTNTNFVGKTVDDAYVFEPSTGGLWGGSTVQNPGFEGGLHVALSNIAANDYTFETIITLSKDADASGLAGIVAFWHYTGNCLFYLIDSATGNVDVGGSAITGTWAKQVKNLSEFGLTTEDEIPVKVVKKAGAFTFYINGQEATRFTHAYYSVCGSFGYCATSPVKGSETTGQVGAKFSCTRCKTNGYTYHYASSYHRFTAWQTVTAATCESKGLERRTCYDCTHYEERDVKALGHVEGEWEIETYPTSSEEGLKVKKCQRCGKTIDTETIPVKTMTVSLTATQKENYSYSFTAQAESGAEADYFGGYAFYQDDANSVLMKIHTLSGEMEIIATLDGVQSTTTCKIGALDMQSGATVKVERLGKVFRFIVGGKLVYQGEYNVSGTAKAGSAYEWEGLLISDETFEDLTKFTNADILFGANESVYAINGTGTQSSTGNVISADCTSQRAWYLFNYKNGQKPMGEVQDFALTVVADRGTDNTVQGADPRAALCIYKDSSFWIDVYFNNRGDNTVLFYGNLGAGENWILLNEKAYYQYIPNYVEGEPITVKIEKLGNTANIFINGEFVRSFSDPKIASAWVGLETKHSIHSYTVSEYKTIDALTEVEHKKLAGSNMTTTYESGVYTFATSANGYWPGGLPCFDGGSMHVAFLDATALEYTFESTVRLSDAETASGIAGVLGFWSSGSKKSWLEITEDGKVNVWAVDGKGYLTEKSLADFGLTVDDEIAVKVVKTAKTITYYVNGTEAGTYTSDNYNIYGHMGFIGTSPASGSGATGQYGAQFKVVSLVMN